MSEDVPPMPISTEAFDGDVNIPMPMDTDDIDPPPPPPPPANELNDEIINDNVGNITNITNINNNDTDGKEESKPPEITDMNDVVIDEEEGGGIIGDLNDENSNVNNTQIKHSQQISLDEGGPIYLNILKMEEWSMDDVCNWLTYRYASWGSQYIDEFKKRNIDGKKLRTLKNKEIINKELGGFIKNRIHLERIW
eukprot:CAMPEP_0114659590 /NCGR_PEP_ID=MMETSP0191-20121206/18167_1 /TAXON_ID=126664 /ORGANISM="Sorites sp." /LENGTH=194 /DNA_ID=CAMNT_0001885299 /DNA_START=32 /DNA_END=613 /DNA_ORIENTATION=+